MRCAIGHCVIGSRLRRNDKDVCHSHEISVNKKMFKNKYIHIILEDVLADCLRWCVLLLTGCTQALII